MTVIEVRMGGGLANLLVASADARSGTGINALGFREHASWALASDTLDFVDLEDIPGVFR